MGGVGGVPQAGYWRDPAAVQRLSRTLAQGRQQTPTPNNNNNVSVVVLPGVSGFFRKV